MCYNSRYTIDRRPKQQFIKADKEKKGELDEVTAMQMFERRGSIRTATELRSLVSAMDQNHNNKLSLLEWCCAHFKKSYEEMNDFVDEEVKNGFALCGSAVSHYGVRMDNGPNCTLRTIYESLRIYVAADKYN